MAKTLELIFTTTAGKDVTLTVEEPRENINDAELLARADCGFRHEEREVILAAQLRDKLVERYGEKGKMVHFAEAYAVSEYGQQLSDELAAKLFPF